MRIVHSARSRASISCTGSAAGLYAVLGARNPCRIHAPWADTFRPHYDPVVWARLATARALTPAANRTRLLSLTGP